MKNKQQLRQEVTKGKYDFKEYIQDDIRLRKALTNDYLATLNEIVLEYISYQMKVIENYASTYGTEWCKGVAENCNKQIKELNRFMANWRMAER